MLSTQMELCAPPLWLPALALAALALAATFFPLRHMHMQVCKLPPPTHADLAGAARHFLCKDQLDTEGARDEVLDEVIKNSVSKKKEVP